MHTRKLVPKPAVRRHPLFLAARDVCRRLTQAGFEAYFVGGAVRDFLLKPDTVATDIDIATSATPDEVSLVFPGSFFVGKSFGVSLVRHASRKFPGRAYSFEVATFRTEGAYTDGRHPDAVAFGTHAQDAERRDFTMNALYFNPLLNRLMDPHGGLSDIGSYVIRAVGNPDVRFREDALRIVRLFRFAATCRMKIHPETLRAAVRCSDGLAKLSKERFVLEFSKVGRGKFDSFARMFLESIDPGLLGVGLPKADVGCHSFFRVPADAHRELPLFSFLIAIVLGCEQKAERFEACRSVFASWPLSRLERRCIEAVEGLLRSGTLSDEGQIAYVLQRFVLKIGDLSLPLAAMVVEFSALVAEPWREICLQFVKVLHDVPNQNGTMLEEWRRMAASAMESSFRISVVSQVKEMGLAESAIAAWLGMAEGMAVFRAMKIGSMECKMETVDGHIVARIEAMRKEIRI